MKTLAELRRSYHDKIGSQIVRFSKKDGRAFPNFADGSSQSSVLIANGIATALKFRIKKNATIKGQTAGNLFEKLTCEFIKDAFTAIRHLRPGRWQYLTAQTQISNFVQYQQDGTGAVPYRILISSGRGGPEPALSLSKGACPSHFQSVIPVCVHSFVDTFTASFRHSRHF
ncbi:MAG: hypothetical protein OXL95_00440 [Nitrospira sp.]|nr:hypothetical protein [Nitrospira sp.]